MSYFVYCIKTLVKEDEKDFAFLDCFDKFLEARDFARTQRGELAEKETASNPETIQAIKIVFASDQEEAVQLLSAKRTPPILREWEK